MIEIINARVDLRAPPSVEDASPGPSDVSDEASASASASASDVDPSLPVDPLDVLDEIEGEIRNMGPPSSKGKCNQLSTKLISLLKKLGYALFYLTSSGIRTLNGVYESKLYFRITVVLLLLGYMLNSTCSIYVNWLISSTIDLLYFFIRNVADEGNLNRLRNIRDVINKTAAILKSIGDFTLEYGIAVIDFLKKVMSFAKDLPEGTFNEVVDRIKEFSELIKSLKMSSEDIKAILESLTALKLSGADMLALLKQLILIIGDMNASQAMAPARDTILERLLQNVPNFAADVGARAVVSAIANGLSRAPTLMPGGSTRKRNKKHKKTTRKNKKVTKKQKKRRKQNKKTKRK
jgi:hypothetical protein